MAMTLLQTVQEFCRRRGLDVPSVVIASQDDQLRQIVGLMHEVIDDLLLRYSWNNIQIEATFTTIAAQDQGAMSTLAPYGFKAVINETLFDRTNSRQIMGPINPVEWQRWQTFNPAGPGYTYRIRGGHLFLFPVPVAGHTIAFEYETENLILAADGVTRKKYFTADDDVFLLSESVLMAGLSWKWKCEKGIRYSEDYRFYDDMAQSASAKDGTKTTLALDNEAHPPSPGIMVPSGNWPQS